MAQRRYGTIVKHLTDDPDTAGELAAKLSDDVLFHLSAALADEQRRRAIVDGNEEAVIADAFETGFGRDGLGVNPYISGSFIVCPGSIIAKSRNSHRCRFASINDTWVWDSDLLINEVKRSNAGTKEGFRAVALLPIIQGTEIDIVTGRMRSGQHSVEHVISYEVKRGKLVEVSQRNVKPSGMA